MLALKAGLRALPLPSLGCCTVRTVGLLPLLCVGLVVCVMKSQLAEAAPPAPCAVVNNLVETEAKQALTERAWAELAPHLTKASIAGLLQKKESEHRWLVHQALGLSKSAEALGALRGPGAVDLPASLALLALGDDSGTSTVAPALFERDVTTRRRTARALARLEQARPRIMLYKALRDEDPAVRLVAAEVHAIRGSRRARRVLDDLLEDKKFGREPARILYESGGRTGLERIRHLDPSIRGRVVVREAVRSRRLTINRLRRMVKERDPVMRAGVLAALALRPVSAKRVRLWARAVPTGELTMTLALMGEMDAVDQLGLLPPEEIPGAVEVIWAYAGAGVHRARLDRELARSIARAVSSWKQGVAPDDVVRMLDALHTAVPEAGAAWARVLLATTDEAKVRQAAARLLRRAGHYQDVMPLLTALKATQDPDARASLLSAAARICGR